MKENRTRSGRIKFLTVAAAIAVLAPTLLLAGPGRGGRCGGPGMHGSPALRGLHQLDLSEEQRQQLHELRATQREEGQAAHQQLREARVTLAQSIHSEAFDETTVRTASQQVAALEEDQAVERALAFQEVRKILTAEQLEELATLRQERGEGHRNCRGPGGGAAAGGPFGE